MAIDARIPLLAQAPDIQGVMEKAQSRQDRLAELAMAERRFQAQQNLANRGLQMDERRLDMQEKEFESGKQLRDLQLVQQKFLGMTAQEKWRELAIAQASASALKFLESGDTQSAAMVAKDLAQRFSRMEQGGVKMGDTQGIEQMANLILQDPQAALQQLAPRVATYRDSGILSVPEMIKLSPDERLVDPSKGFQEVARGLPKRPDSTTTVNVNNAGEKMNPTQKAITELDNDYISTIVGQDNSSGEELASLSVMEDLIKSGTETGAFDGMKMLFGQMGIDVPDAANLETIKGLSNQLSVPLVKQLGMNPTDNDLKVIQSTVAGVGKTTEGNLQLIDLRRQILTRQGAKARIARSMADAGANSGAIIAAMKEYDKDNPLKVNKIVTPKAASEMSNDELLESLQ